MNISPSICPVIMAHEPIHADAMADTSQAVSLENAKGVYMYCFHVGAGATNVDLTVHEGSTKAIAEAGTYPLTTKSEFPIWINILNTTTDAWVRQPDALTYTIVASAVPALVCFYIDSSMLTNGRMWVHLGASAGNAANFICAWYQMVGGRYQQYPWPTVIA